VRNIKNVVNRCFCKRSKKPGETVKGKKIEMGMATHTEVSSYLGGRDSRITVLSQTGQS
jgi:hypothetical protein